MAHESGLGWGNAGTESQEPIQRRTFDLRHVLLLSVVVALVAGLVGGALGYLLAGGNTESATRLGTSDSSTSELAERPPESVAGVVEAVQPTVVTIVIPGCSVGDDDCNGSGFIITDDGFILTNNHVVAASPTGDFTVIFADSTTSSATVQGTDPGSDLAVIKVERNNLPVLPLADSDSVKTGDPAIAFGAPLGLSHTVTAGIVSAVDRPVVTGSTQEVEAYMAAIQTDAAVNIGNSGGPLVDGGGRAIGVNTAIATVPGSEGNVGVGFAVPMNHARRVAEQLINSGEASTTIIGAFLDPSYDDPAGGARLREVESGGPADDAGLRTGDVIRKFQDRVVEDSVALIALIRKNSPDTEVTIEYERGGEVSTATLTLSST